MPKLRVLHLMATNFVGGPEKQILSHAGSVNSQSFEIIIGSFSEGRPDNPLLLEAAKRSLPTFLIDSKTGFDPRQILGLGNYLRASRIHILCTHGYKSNFIGYWATRSYRIPLVAFLRGWTGEDWKVKVYDLVDRFWIRFADLIVCVSEAKKRELLELKVPLEKIEVVYNAFDLRSLWPGSSSNIDIRREYHLPAQSKIVASFGRLSPEKGQKYLILAADAALGKRKDIYFLIFGEGREKENLQMLAQRLGLEKNVILAGFVKNPLDYIRQIDLLVNPSLTEGLPNVILEALALKKPIIATSVGGVPEIILDNQTGFLVPSQNPQPLADQILFALENPNLTAQAAERGYQLLQTKFSLQAQTEKLQKIYRRVTRL